MHTLPCDMICIDKLKTSCSQTHTGAVPGAQWTSSLTGTGNGWTKKTVTARPTPTADGSRFQRSVQHRSPRQLHNTVCVIVKTTSYWGLPIESFHSPAAAGWAAEDK